MTWKIWLLIGITVAVVAAVGGPYTYIHFVDGKAAPKLTLAPSTASPSSASSGSVDGTWKISSGSVVGYRVGEVLAGQSNTAVGRTNAVTGSLTVNGSSVTAASFSVDMTTVTSVNEKGDAAGGRAAQRDRQFQGRIMQTSTYPTAAFQLTQPISFPFAPPQGSVQNKMATGKLTLHGVTKTVTFPLKCERNGDTAQVNGSIPVTFADFNIQNPSFAFITTQDHGTLEFTLDLKHA